MKATLTMVVMGDLLDQSAEVQDFAAASELLTGLYFDDVLAGLIGFIPQGQDAYLWMVKTPVAMAHPLVFARYAKRTIDCLKTKYGVVHGHSDYKSRKWLRFLGAEVKPLDAHVVEFTIHGR